MASHLSSIGFPVGSEDEAQALVGRVANDAEELDTPDGAYLRYADPSGAELWLHLDGQGVVVDMHPHYAGETRDAGRGDAAGAARRRRSRSAARFTAGPTRAPTTPSPAPTRSCSTRPSRRCTPSSSCRA